jgi:transposase
MSGKRYSAEYKRRVVELFKAGRSVMDLSRDFKLDHTTVRTWILQMAVDAGEAPGLTADEKAELNRLRRENAELREEREILKKFAAWSAKEANWSPKKGSDS